LKVDSLVYFDRRRADTTTSKELSCAKTVRGSLEEVV